MVGLRVDTQFTGSRQRFRDDGDDTGWRFRQFFKLVYPLPDKPDVSLVAYDELFFGLNNTDWGVESGFDRNRLFLGAGWTVGRGKTSNWAI